MKQSEINRAYRLGLDGFAPLRRALAGLLAIHRYAAKELVDAYARISGRGKSAMKMLVRAS